MSITFTDYDFDTRWQESLAHSNGYTFDGIEEIEPCPDWLGQGQRRSLWLSGSLRIQVDDTVYGQNWFLQREHEPFFPLTAKFYIAGRSQVNTQGIADAYIEQAGENYLYCLSDTAEAEAYLGNDRFHMVMIWLPPSRLRLLGLEHMGSLPLELQQFLDDVTPPFFHRNLGATTPEMHQILQRLLGCPHHGFTKQLYLESLALELLSLQFARWMELEQGKAAALLLRSDEVERVQQAQAILRQNLIKPPSLIELSRQVGLNDYKLKLGFRQVLGTSPFAYLRNQRLDLARQLLSETEMAVEQVAIAVGYKSRSSFTAAFRRKFSTCPKVMQQMSQRLG
jgi:AraC-like DNA-binding protein